VLTLVTTTVAVAFVFLGVRECRRRRSTAPAWLLGSGAVCLFLEPVYDDQFHIWFHDQGHMWRTYTAYGMPQPVWVPITYAWCYGGLAMLVWRRLADGGGRREVLRMAGGLLAVFTAFELIGINLGVYTYYGAQPLRLMGLPLWVEVPNTVLTVVAAVAFARLEPMVHGLGRLCLLAVVPGAFAAVSFGAAFPTLVTISRTDPSPAVVYLSTAASFALAAAMLHLALQTVPADEGLGERVAVDARPR
jgi:hypothetical protein